MFTSMSTKAARVVFNRAPVAPATIATQQGLTINGSQQQRSVMSLSDLKQRIKATANVAKLTNVMKLVASSKLRNVEKSLAAGRPFGLTLMDSVSLDDESMEALYLKENEEGSTNAKIKQLVVIMTTDRGLCGSVNSTISRMLPSYVAEQREKGFEPTFFVLGEKGRAQVTRMFSKDTIAAIDNAFDKDPVFPLAAALGEKIVAEEFDLLTLVYNRYDSAAKFTTLKRHFPQFSGLGVGILPEKFKGYSVEPENNEETLVNMMEFSVAGSLFYAMLETKACETSQRVTAMDNASSNAGDMVDRYTLLFNRARQAKITTELTEIISGAESIADEED